MILMIRAQPLTDAAALSPFPLTLFKWGTALIVASAIAVCTTPCMRRQKEEGRQQGRKKLRLR